MIEGITILNQEIITEIAFWALPVALLLCVICVLIFGLIFDDWGWIAGLILSILIMIILLKIVPEIPTGRYRYTVTIDDSVSFKDVLEKYDVIEQQGKMWILEDKEIDEK